MGVTVARVAGVRTCVCVRFVSQENVYEVRMKIAFTAFGLVIENG